MARSAAAAAAAAAANGTTRNPYPHVKTLIYERDTTQRKVARAADLDETRLSDILRGRVSPTPDDKRRIARALDATVRECFGG